MNGFIGFTATTTAVEQVEGRRIGLIVDTDRVKEGRSEAAMWIIGKEVDGRTIDRVIHRLAFRCRNEIDQLPGGACDVAEVIGVIEYVTAVQRASFTEHENTKGITGTPLRANGTSGGCAYPQGEVNGYAVGLRGVGDNAGARRQQKQENYSWQSQL